MSEHELAAGAIQAEIDQTEAELADVGKALDQLAIQAEGGPEADRRFHEALRQSEDETR